MRMPKVSKGTMYLWDGHHPHVLTVENTEIIVADMCNDDRLAHVLEYNLRTNLWSMFWKKHEELTSSFFADLAHFSSRKVER